ncbi:MAG: PIN domain-containing protein [Acidobacteria bacterium]|nr:PIN domain-containing protein [Acidobacteriota bacterium]
MLVDTSGLLSAMFKDQRRHESCRAIVESHTGSFLLSPFVLAELDYLVGKLAGVDAELALLDEVARGAYQLAEFTPLEVSVARDVVAEYRDLGLGLADASIISLGRLHGCAEVLTLDERHFRAVMGPAGKPFRLLPADA